MIAARGKRDLEGIEPDPLAFARSVGFNPDPWQAEVLQLQNKRLLLNCSRQSGKSSTTAALALHRALIKAGALILLVSPSLRQSSELFAKVTAFRNMLQQRPRLTEENKLSIRFQNGSRIVSLPGKEGTIRGFSGVDLIIEDEASRVPDDLYRAVRPMLATSGGRLMLLSTPFGKRGHFYEAWTTGGAEWQRVKITAEECPRISTEFLAEERRALPAWWFQQEYQCEFSETIDSIFTMGMIEDSIHEGVRPFFSERNHNDIGIPWQGSATSITGGGNLGAIGPKAPAW